MIADANSMTYVLHKALGDDIVIEQDGQPLRLRLVAALADSIFQSELIMSDANFRTLFAGHDGYRLLLVDAASERAAGVASALEQGGRDLGADVVPTVERLAEFHRVENTFISTFQTLGGLGLLVGTVGMAAVLFRNVLERRRDLALLGAVGYRKGHVFVVVLVESVLLLAWGDWRSGPSAHSWRWRRRLRNAAGDCRSPPEADCSLYRSSWPGSWLRSSRPAPRFGRRCSARCGRSDVLTRRRGAQTRRTNCSLNGERSSRSLAGSL